MWGSGSFDTHKLPPMLSNGNLVLNQIFLPQAGKLGSTIRLLFRINPLQNWHEK